jgi:hypothetical protein
MALNLQEHDPRINGRLDVSIDYDKEGIATRYTFKWRGGDVVGVTRSFLEMAEPVSKIDGDILAIGPYQMRLIAWDIARNYGVYERVKNGA